MIRSGTCWLSFFGGHLLPPRHTRGPGVNCSDASDQPKQPDCPTPLFRAHTPAAVQTGGKPLQPAPAACQLGHHLGLRLSWLIAGPPHCSLGFGTNVSINYPCTHGSFITCGGFFLFFLFLNSFCSSWEDSWKPVADAQMGRCDQMIKVNYVY